MMTQHTPIVKPSANISCEWMKKGDGTGPGGHYIAKSKKEDGLTEV
jgi:hypothetical protein